MINWWRWSVNAEYNTLTSTKCAQRRQERGKWQQCLYCNWLCYMSDLKRTQTTCRLILSFAPSLLASVPFLKLILRNVWNAVDYSPGSYPSVEYWIYSIRGNSVVFTRSEITQPKVNLFGWNIEFSEYIVGGWSWQILGAIRALATVWEAAKIFCPVNNARFCRFPVGKISRNLTTTTSIGEGWKLSLKILM